MWVTIVLIAHINYIWSFDNVCEHCSIVPSHPRTLWIMQFLFEWVRGQLGPRLNKADFFLVTL